VRGRRSTKFIGRVVGFDTETNLWQVLRFLHPNP
jgi:hypothetical protein